MGSTSILRGFKVSVSTLDEFLEANLQHRTEGIPPFYQHHPDEDPISRLLFAKVSAVDPTADKISFRVLIPSVEGSPRSPVAYVTYAWATVMAHRELKLAEDLPEEVPRGFEELRSDILSFRQSDDENGRMGVYMVTTYEIRGLYIPLKIRESPQYCDQCDAVFDHGAEGMAWYERHQHRRNVHGVPEPAYPFPDY